MNGGWEQGESRRGRPDSSVAGVLEHSTVCMVLVVEVIVIAREAIAATRATYGDVGLEGRDWVTYDVGRLFAQLAVLCRIGLGGGRRGRSGAWASLGRGRRWGDVAAGVVGETAGAGFLGGRLLWVCVGSALWARGLGGVMARGGRRGQVWG